MTVKVNLDKVAALIAALAVVVLPVLTQDHILKSKLAADLGLAIGTFLAGYHIKPGQVLGGAAEAVDQVADQVTDAGSGGVPDMAQTQA